MPWGILQINKEPEDAEDVTRSTANIQAGNTNASMSKSELNALLEAERLEKLEADRQRLLNNKRN